MVGQSSSHLDFGILFTLADQKVHAQPILIFFELTFSAESINNIVISGRLQVLPFYQKLNKFIDMKGCLHSEIHEMKQKLCYLNAYLCRMSVSLPERHFVIFDNSTQQNNSNLLEPILTCAPNKSSHFSQGMTPTHVSPSP